MCVRRAAERCVASVVEDAVGDLEGAYELFTASVSKTQVPYVNSRSIYQSLFKHFTRF